MRDWNYGYIKISDNIYTTESYKEFVWKIFEHFRPVSMEYIWKEEAHIFYGYSDLFEKRDHSEITHEYSLMILKEKNKIKISFKKL
jgi:hypothetical protein